MKLISWNINAKVKNCEQQAYALLDFAPHLVALQEVRPKAAPIFKSIFQANGLEYILDTTDLAIKNGRSIGVMIASVWPMKASSVQFEVPYQERVLSVEVEHPDGEISLHTVHVPPGSSNGWKKIETLEGIFDALSKPLEKPNILCGDFNTPKMELPNGDIMTWGQRVTKSGNITIKPGFERWDRGERNILGGLEGLGFINVFCALNGYEGQEKSWERRIHGKIHGYRYDHVFSSPVLGPRRCRYLQVLREKGLSDHSPIEVLFQQA